jgi:hypothetical protein
MGTVADERALGRWLAELARLADREKTPEGFIRSASETLVRLLWLKGVGYHVANAGGSSAR